MHEKQFVMEKFNIIWHQTLIKNYNFHCIITELQITRKH